MEKQQLRIGFMQPQKLMDKQRVQIIGVNMSEPECPYPKRPNKQKTCTLSPMPSPDLPQGHPPNTPPIETQQETKQTPKKARAVE
jgi:hypothetical protein